MSTATFLKSDTATQGTWYNGGNAVYGVDGWGMAVYGTDNPNYPSYATVTETGGTLHTWATSTTDVRALEYPPIGTSNGSDSNRIAATWFNTTNFNVDIQDGSSHRIAMYFVDWTSGGRDQQVQITDDLNGNAVLDTRTISSFGNGIWLVWLVSGKVTITFTNLGGSTTNAVLSGVFFDTPIGTLFPPIVSRLRFEPAYYE